MPSPEVPGREAPPQDAGGRGMHAGVVGVVLAYAAVAGAWILLSDRAVEAVFGNQAEHTLAQTLKGLAFVGVTSLLLYALVRRLVSRLVAALRLEREARRQAARAQGLLDAIAEGSTDAIFAKDADGRYLLFNAAACRFTGTGARGGDRQGRLGALPARAGRARPRERPPGAGRAAASRRSRSPSARPRARRSSSPPRGRCGTRPGACSACSASRATSRPSSGPRCGCAAPTGTCAC